MSKSKLLRSAGEVSGRELEPGARQLLEEAEELAERRDQPRDLPNPTTGFDITAAGAHDRRFHIAQFHARCREAVERARRTRKPQIAWIDDDRPDGHIWRVYPIAFDKGWVPTVESYWDRRNWAELFLHEHICRHADWDSIWEMLSYRDRQGELKFHGQWADLKPGEQWKPHTPDLCVVSRWRWLEKERGRLCDEWFAAAGLFPEYGRHAPWRGALLVREMIRHSKRGRPALKHAWYDLATAYKLSVLDFEPTAPYKFFPELAYHLSLPWFGLRFSAHELRQAAYEIEGQFQTPGAVLRNPITAEVLPC